MKFSVFKRITGKKGEINRIRREGNVPCILYGYNQPGETIYLNGDEVRAMLRNMKAGTLSTTVFELEEGQKKHKAIVKEIQYHPVSYAVQHIDFALLSDEREVTVNIPIEIAGVADCAGIKLGGFLRQAIRMLKVTCLPKHIPSKFILDVKDLGIAQSKKLSDIEMPAHVRPKGKMNEVAVVIAKKAGT